MTRRRLIERDALHLEASVAGLRERYSRGETQHTIHVWWARRPHAAMRALLLFSLVREGDGVSLEDASDPERVRKAVRRAYGGCPPKVLDPFGGGGTIPYEAACLGAEAYSVDSNAVAVFNQHVNLVYSAVLKDSRTKDALRATGEKALALLAAATGPLFPGRTAGVMTYLWTYVTRCTGCGKRFSLSKRPWLSKKKGVFFAYRKRFVVETSGKPEPPHWNGRQPVCPHCGQRQKASFRTAEERLCSVACAAGRGKVFRVGKAADLPDEELLQATETAILQRLGKTLPDTLLPKWSGIINPGIYGMETHAETFNPRQRCVILHLIEILRTLHCENERQYGGEIARFVTGALSGLIDQLVDWNSRLSMWIPQNEQVGRALCGPGVAMLWDYAETDPVGKGPSNLHAKLQRILRGVEALEDLPAPVQVTLGSATQLPFADGAFDAVVTDPPYYDNLFYAALADFIYPWKRLLLEDVVPEFFQSDLTDSENELVSSTFRSGSANEAHARYCRMLNRAFAEMARVLKPDGIFALVYSHASVAGWAALVEAFQRSPFRLQSAQPLAIERRERPRAIASAAVNTCIVFVAHLGRAKPQVDQKAALALICARAHTEFLNELKRIGWNDHDAGIALFARLLTPICNLHPEGVNLTELITRAGEVVTALCPAFRLSTRSSI